MYKAVLSDLDGTLLDKDHKLKKRTIEVINEFVNMGYKFYIATGRNYNGASVVMKELGLDIDLICINGSRITDSKGNPIFNKKLEPNDSLFLSSIDYKNFGDEIFINGYEDDNWYVSDGDEAINYYTSIRNDREFNPIPISKEEFKEKLYNKIYFIGEHNNLLKLEKYIEEQNLNVNISFVSDKCLEIYHKDCSKLNAAKILLKRDNIDISEVISFGDGLNDFEMLTGTGKSFVMKNAIYLLKEKLKPFNIEEIGDSDDNAVAEKIVEIFKR